MTPGAVLIIDDNEELAENLAEILDAEGIEAHVAASGADGLRQLASREFGAVITDMRMPEMTGLDVVRKVKESWPHVPVVVMTAYARDEMLESALQEGALEILSKPVDFKRLLELSERLAGDRASQVLVLEDDADLRTSIVEVLQTQSSAVPQPVATIASARRLLERQSIDAAIIDLRLPDGSGLEFSAYLREVAKVSRIVFVTGFRSEFEDTIDASLREPGVHLLEKPFRVEALLELVRGDGP